ncbi:MAG: monofunctional biosynthetic peptidoglycan transglycosylase [Oceanospirillaceae bacterium]|nr:monofunctional biosynthetic peptidoglycan transglycosylase [Oceanospirillaceae bacterium]MCP5350549.1 monofunctional biosynthetic peptidoglycan transglycosylase [Oceanospirillaceae bacterium]
MSFLHPRRWPRLLFWLCAAFAFYLLALALYTLWQIPPFQGEGALAHVREDAQAAVAEKRDGNIKGYKWASLGNINKQAYQAIIASEDGRFYQHGGIDWDAIQQAAEKNWQRKTFSVGGSTITQQTVKNVYLSNSRSLIRKYRELMGTYLLEHNLKKKEILEVYLNIIEFGPDIYGIHHAARYYFNKTPAELNAREGAFLAVLMPAPKKYFYSIYQAKRMNTRHNRKYQRILRDMRRQGNLSEAQYRNFANHTFYGAPPLDKNTIDNLDDFDEQLAEENSAENTDSNASSQGNTETPAVEAPASENTSEDNTLTPEQTPAPATPDATPVQEEAAQPENKTEAGDISA